MDLDYYQQRLDKFAKERNWDQFHSPKNLTMALAGETGELLDIFQWLTEEESKRENIDDQLINEISEEMADIMIYLLRLTDKLNIDIEASVKKKIGINEKKYPIKLSKDNAIKYSRR